MIAIDTRLWAFDAELEDGDSVQCPDKDCAVVSPLADWSETDSYCEDCGSHSAIECPVCLLSFDHVWTEETFHVVKRQSDGQ